MKKRNILRRILAVVLVLTMATGLTAQAKGDASSTSLKEAQKEKAALEKQLKADHFTGKSACGQKHRDCRCRGRISTGRSR